MDIAIKKISWLHREQHVTPKDLAIYTRQWAILLNSGIPMIRIFNIMLQQTTNPKLKEVTESLQKFTVKHGLALSQALAKHKDVFPLLYIIMVKCGESSGVLPMVMNRLADNLEKNVRMLNQFKATLTYPAITLLGSIITIIFIFKYVLPSLFSIFSLSKLKLPFPTKVLMALNNLLGKWWFCLLIIIIGITLIIWLKSYLKTQRGKESEDNLLMHIPIISTMIPKTILARFCRTLMLLYTTGYPLLGSFRLLKDIVNNTVYEREIEKVIKDIVEGDSIANALEKRPLFPRALCNMIAAGEESGNLPKVLSSLNYYYELEIESFLENVNTLLEPLIITFLGILVGFILIATLLPLYRMIGSLGTV